MLNRRVLGGVGLVLVAAICAVLVVALTWGDDSASEADAVRIDPIAATGTLTPRIVLFGDTVSAVIDVVVDRTIIDADQVTVSGSFAPWQQVGNPERSRSDTGRTAHLRTTYVLRCLTTPCVPARETEQIDFDPARVTYAAPVGEGTRRLSVDVQWPTLVVHTRVGDAENRRDVLAAPWRADLLSLPLVSYRASPGLVLALLLIGGTFLVLLAGVLVYRAIPEREPPPEPEPEPVPVATLLEQALALLEAPVGTDGAPDRRRALELVADEVESRGDAEFALAARALAWSEHAPEGDKTKAFAAELRSRIKGLDGAPA